MIYNKNVQELITERHAFEPDEHDLTISPMPVGGPTDPPTFAPTPATTTVGTPAPTLATTPAPTLAPTSAPSSSPITPGSPTRAPTTPVPSAAPFAILTVESFLTRTTDDGALNEIGSPQNLAYEGILTDFPDLDPNIEADQVVINEIYALSTTFYATNGGNWRDRTGWPGPSLPCDTIATWFGLTCNVTSGRVIQIDLTSNDLMGQLPSEIRVLPSLGTIYVTLCDLVCSVACGCLLIPATH
jgi:hypothetical protein